MSESLSEKIAFFRVERPSEWLMDEFKRDAEALEQRIKELEQENVDLKMLSAMGDLKSSLAKLKLEQQAHGIELALGEWSNCRDANLRTNLSHFAGELRKKAEELK